MIFQNIIYKDNDFKLLNRTQQLSLAVEKIIDEISYKEGSEFKIIDAEELKQKLSEMKNE